MLNLQADIIPHEARCFSLQLCHCLVNPSKLRKAGGSQDSMLILLLDAVNNFVPSTSTHLVGQDH